MKAKLIKPRFVKFIPEDVKDDVLYISIPYGTAIHKCACGCGETVVTPIRPTDWTLIWNGEKVTLDPSIGNWSLPCKSHYLIIENKIVWATRWSRMKIEASREKDKIAKARYYSKLQPLQRKRG
jgi:hypothetical protein